MSTTSAKIILAFGLGALLAATLMIGALVATGEIGGEEEAVAERVQVAEATSPAAPRTSPTSIAEIYERVSPGVVFINASRGGGQGRLFGPQDGAAATGSGFLIDDEGFIVTNDHVVEGAQEITVRFGDGEPVSAELRGRDPSSDIALLQVAQDDIPDEVSPVELAASDDLRPGDAAIAIGSPFGLAGTVTTGIVSALDREIRAPNGFTISGVLQTDAAINPGNSGGPLLNERGRAIGVNSQIATDGSGQSSGVGFAVPIDTVKQLVPALRRGEVVERAWLGVSTAENPAGDGVLVGEVVSGSPAARAGIRPGDVIVSMAGEQVREPGEIARAVSAQEPGDTLSIGLRRGDDERSIEVRLGVRPQDPAR